MATYSSFLETDDCDIAIINGDFVMVENAEFVAQQLGTDYRLSKNNWFLDLDEGINYVDGDNGVYGAREITPELEQAFILTATTGVGVRDLANITFEFSGSDNTDFEVTPTIISEFAPDEIEIPVSI